MPFDINTAKPITAQPSGFDISTAKPIEQPQKESIFGQFQAGQDASAAAQSGAIDQLGRDIVGGLEGAATLVTSIPASIVGGIAGLAAAPQGFIEGKEGVGARTAKQVQEALTFQPRTESGKQALAPVQKLGEKLEAGKKFLGDDALAATGSPFIAAVAHTLPDATLSLLGVRGLQSSSRAAQLADIKKITKPPVEIRPVSTLQSAAKQKIGELILQGSDDISTAGVKLKQPTGLLAKLNKGAPRVVKDVAATDAIKQGFDPGIIATIKGSNKLDKFKMSKMVDVTEKALKSKRFGAQNRASDVLGDSLKGRIDFVRSANKKAGANLDRIASESLKNKTINAEPAVKSFIGELNKMDINTAGGLKDLKFEGSTIPSGTSGAATAQNTLKTVARQLDSIEGPNAFKLHKLKRLIDTQVEFGKSSVGKAGAAARALKTLRRNIDDTLDSNFPKYDKVNTIFSETRTALDNMQTASGRTLNLAGTQADKALGTKLRGLLSNNQSRINLMDSINEIEKMAAKNGGRFQDDLLSQALFVDELETMFKTAARTGFKGQIKQAITEVPLTTGQAVVKGAETVIEKVRGVNQESAIKSIKELLKETK